MPLPTPRSGESRNDFISRCMSNETAREDFPDRQQRAGVCFTQWRRGQRDGMEAMEFNDTVMLDGVRRTEDGFLVAEARVARTGVQVYRGREVGRPDMDSVRVYRPEDEVFARDALHTFAFRPVTVDHPSEMVTAENWRDFAVGQTGGEVARDGETVRVPMVLMDKTAIDAVENGKQQLSMGYTATIDWTDGETPGGERYDAVQRNLKMNHLAVVAAARGGSELRIGDDDERGRTMPDHKTRTITVDSIPVEVPDHAAAVIEKALKDAEQKVADAEKAKADAEATVAERDKTLATKDAEIDDLKSKQIDEKALNAKVQERAALVDRARKVVADFDPSGKTDAEIKRSIVVAKVGDEMGDKADAYIDARFDMLVEAADGGGGGGGPDPLRNAISGMQPAGDPRAKAHDAYAQRLKDGWKGEQKGAN